MHSENSQHEKQIKYKSVADLSPKPLITLLLVFKGKSHNAGK